MICVRLGCMNVLLCYRKWMLSVAQRVYSGDRICLPRQAVNTAMKQSTTHTVLRLCLSASRLVRADTDAESKAVSLSTVQTQEQRWNKTSFLLYFNKSQFTVNLFIVNWWTMGDGGKLYTLNYVSELITVIISVVFGVKLYFILMGTMSKYSLLLLVLKSSNRNKFISIVLLNFTLHVMGGKINTFLILIAW